MVWAQCKMVALQTWISKCQKTLTKYKNNKSLDTTVCTFLIWDLRHYLTEMSLKHYSLGNEAHCVLYGGSNLREGNTCFSK